MMEILQAIAGGFIGGIIGGLAWFALMVLLDD